MTSPPGWYTAPDRPGTLRWWDGHRWTERTAPIPPSPPPRPPLGDGWARLALAVQTFLGLYLLLHIAEAVFFVWMARLLGRWAERPRTVDLSAAETMERWALVTAVADFSFLLLCGPLFIAWLYQAHRSDRMYPAALRHRSGWAIGGWFVPILNLWRPVQMVHDVRRGAVGHDPTSGRAIVGMWWTLWVVSWVAARVSLSFLPDEDARPREVFETLHTGAWVDVGGTVISFGTGVLALLVVRHVTRLVLDAPARSAAASGGRAASVVETP